MSLVNYNSRRAPWFNGGIEKWLGNEEIFLDTFFDRKASLPAMNIKENPLHFEIELAVPGFDKEDIEVSLENDILHILAENKNEMEEENEYTHKEFSYHSLERKLQIPKSINQDKEVRANSKNGVLKLHLTKNDDASKPTKKEIGVV
ncbi:Hsp20/alpha crystallin family protein [Psychroflexus sp. MES1-P1E]|uniref:Hsp20/alpha crystallin family protein n=1 Tax=Psychroflexus sp. MES1-P1E TaxID=2058320 RepID=UPI000C7C2C2B|nr:Hsp20/alpha crystallin family protein [Psychroflexus sp. MES1-P1E]PKG43308.1 heat-shock protein [Psychroflexus sp. MES1-P1E]